MSAFARWFAVHPVQAFVWLYAHRLPRLRLRVCPAMLWVAPALALRLLRPCPRSRSCDFWAVSQEVGADFAMSLDFCAVFGGDRSPSAPPIWENAGAARRFGPIWPAKPPRSCERGSRATEVAHLDTCSDSVSAGRRSRMSKRLKPTGVRAISRTLV